MDTQDPDTVDRAGLRRKLLKAQAEAGDIVLLFGDESEALTTRTWRTSGPRKGPICAFRHRARRQSGDARGARLGPARAHRVHQADQAPFGRHRAPGGGRSALWAQARGVLKPVVLVLDNGPIHTSKMSRAALAERAHWLTVEWLPKYAPELNDIEVLWRDLKRHHLAHQTFAGPEDLDQAIQDAVRKLNTERSRHPLANHQIAA
jgi:transposase